MATLDLGDLRFILAQIRIAEAHAGGADLRTLLPNDLAMLGLRTVDGSFNNLVPGQQHFGAADQPFPRLVDAVFSNDADGDTFLAPPPIGLVSNTDYGAAGHVADADPRIISNLIVNQTISNPAAVQAFVDAGLGVVNAGVLHYLNDDGTQGPVVPAHVTLTIPNATPDEGLSAGFNQWFVFFGQFFDHGLDLVNKGGNGTVFIPLQADDPLILVGRDGIPNTGDELTNPALQFMQLTRAELDGTESTNQTSPFVDQNQTYTSHPSHQVFVRQYELNAAGDPVATGRLITGADGGMATWAEVKLQARTLLGIELTDQDAVRGAPEVRVDPYGKFIPGTNGFVQLIVGAGADGIVNTADDLVIEGNPAAPVSPAAVGALRTGHAFLDDIAHTANPFSARTGLPLTQDVDAAVGLAGSNAAFYDNELLDRHFIAGDGRVNENIALTAVHHVFHSEHNRQVEEIKATVLASGDAAFIASWQTAPGVWNGERLFQAAKFATEMQYQHLVFEEFARTVQPNIDEFLMYDATINPAIVAEFAHTVYRFGHSMLLETVDRLDPNFESSEMGLIAAFLNPLGFNDNGALTPEEAAGAIVRGTTRQLGNEVDEFITGALRNNLVGLPLDLGAINIARGRDTGVPTLNAARREFFEGTGDSQLAPYTSWADFAAHLRHPESVINFIAAYGTHDAIVGATTLADKRGAATLLVLGDGDDSDGVTIGGVIYTDRGEFLNSTGPEWSNGANGVTVTGVDAIDLWIGGLAEQQMPFGGLLGSTFNFVFETQLEALQNGDRFYYLGRLAGLNFLTEMENNSFAKLISANTDVTHLPMAVFTTPGFILEVDPTQQFTGLGADNRADPSEGGTALTPIVIRDNPATAGADTNYLQYTGGDHVVLGGTNPGNLANPSGNDILISGIGDDTLHGDGGNDRLEGGDGVDSLLGGDGHDIITDLGGDDVLKGEGGNDVIHGGNGLNLIIGGPGHDFIITGEDISDTFGGGGNDFILGAKTNLPSLGNEGNDWIEIGTQDGAPGDNFDLLNLDAVNGHDVFIGGGGFDEMLGEGGHDVFVGSEGEDHFDGSSGFDWTTYKNDTRGVTVDLKVNDFVEPRTTPSNAGIMDRFAFVEGLSGSSRPDILRGDDQEAADILIAGARGSVLDQEGIDLVSGLQAVVGAGVTNFSGGNIILGGGGSDILEGRAGNDILEGDRFLNVRISIRAGIDANGDATGAEIGTADSMAGVVRSTNPALNGQPLTQLMLGGGVNPGQLVAVREVLQATNPGYDTAMFSAPRANYTVSTSANGTTVVTDNRVVGVDPVTLIVTPVTDGVDTLRGIERLQFADQVVLLVAGGNAAPVGTLTVGGTAQVNGTLTASAAGITDANGGIAAGSTNFLWQVQLNAGSGVFTDIVQDIGGSPSLAHGNAFRVTPDLDGLQVRARITYRDGNGTLENVFSAPITIAGPALPAPAAPQQVAESPTVSSGNGVHFIRSDLAFILDQIKIAEAHSGAYGAASVPLTDLLPNSRVAFGLRTVDGSFNNLLPGQTNFGAADQSFPNTTDTIFRNERDDSFDSNGPAPGGQVVSNNNYASTVSVADADPRIISNLIVDQTITNPVAVQTFIDAGFGVMRLDGLHHLNADGTDGPLVLPGETLTIPNATPDEGLSAGFNSWFTFFGQFFDHGLDLVNKGGAGTVFIPLRADDPLITHGPDGVAGTGDELTDPTLQFMAVTRATNTAVLPGADGAFGTADDIHRHNNQTTPFIDQNQTYTSHPSHQVFLREYELNAAGDPVSTGRLIDGVNGGIGNWAEVKAQAQNMLGIQLSDLDVLNVPMLRTDAYGKFIPGPTGLPQFATRTGNGPIVYVEANGGPVPANVVRTNHAFLDDIAHVAAPMGRTGPLTPDADDAVGLTGSNTTSYDDELLDAHFITGDGRGNENIALTTVHFVFHAEHNRLAGHIQEVILASNDASFLSEWLINPTAAATIAQAQAQLAAIAAATTPEARAAAVEAAVEALNWDGERLFQAARFGTEMQYQHLVFEEFARKVQPQVDIFFAPTQVYDTAINPAIFAEFAHTVYRFGHSMLTETVDRFDPAFNVIGVGLGNEQITLIEAFLNPLAFTASGDGTDESAASNVIRGVTRQLGNEIDEFVTDALRNNLVGLPLDLAAINMARGRDTGVPPLNAARADFYQMTGDAQLKPYTSWVDFSRGLRHEASLMNFIAAYGTHDSITGAATTAAKRAAAYAIVYGEGGLDGIVVDDPTTLQNEAADNPTVTVPADRLAFLNSTGAWANNAPAPIGGQPKAKDVDGVTTTGLGNVDFWIGGLAERQMPFGGLLGSTFNFVFETQMEKLQDGDRFYYLERTQGLNFLTELENNSFAKLIMANTDVEHLPGDVFTTPAFTLEVDQTKQFTGLGLDGRGDPEGVVRGPGYLQYTGEDHVVLGGTNSGNDTLIASIGDDTLYGDDGNDRLEGGDGVDILFGGAGDDIITDKGGDDLIQGQDGNDAIHGGNGINLILGGFGKDFIVTGEDASESFGGHGDDFILGVRADEFVFGNEGDDWIELGMVDGAAGDNFDAFGLDAVRGNDVFIGEGITDRMDGEGGDDIMVGNGGAGDRYEGLSGFDWAVFKDAPTGAIADLTLRAFDETPVPANEALLARFTSVEGLSGSAHDDFLRGDNNTAAQIAVSGAYGSVLENRALITGLQSFLNDMLPGAAEVTSFGAGNIILGGAGSDLIEGRGGDDLIDGDMWLNVALRVGDQRFANMRDPELLARVFSGDINPGDIHIVRELLTSATPDFDTAVFSGNLADYTFELDGVEIDADALRDGIAPGSVVTVINDVDGTDRVRNVERLQFSDDAIVLNGSNAAPVGLLTLNDLTPAENQLLTVSSLGVTDLDNVSGTNPTGALTGPITYFWQQEVRDGVWEDIIILNEAPESVRATGTTFTPGDAQVGLALRVRAVYNDANGVLETAYSGQTAPVTGLNDVPFGALTVSDTSPTETQAIVALPQFADPDGMTTSVLSYQWEQANNTGVGGGAAGFTPIAGATLAQFTPGALQVNRELRVVATYTDDQGFGNTVTSAATTVTGDFFAGGGGVDNYVNVGAGNGNPTLGDDIASGGDGGDTLSGFAGDDILNGNAGGDTVNGGLGNDVITGGTGADTLNGNEGNDTFAYTVGDGVDLLIDGGADTDTLNILGQAGNNLLDAVAFNGTSLTGMLGGVGNLANLEAVNADLLGGSDSLEYTLGSAAVTVNLTTGVASGFASITSIENVTGTNNNDTFTTSSAANEIGGFGGDDRFIMTAADVGDAISGGGDINGDTLDLSGISALNSATVTLAGIGAVVINGNAVPQNNSVQGVEHAIGTQGNDTITGSVANNIIDGQAGNDVLAGLDGTDVLRGGAGADTLRWVTGDLADLLDGGDDNDTLAVSGTGGANTLAVGFNGTAVVSVGGGVVQNVEAVTADLLGGNDTLSYTGLANSAGVTVNLGAGTASGFTSIANIENVTGSAFADTLTGTAGANTLSGGDGNDTLSGGLGNDALNGNGGTDTASYVGETDNLFINLAAGQMRRGSNVAPVEDTLNTIENVIGGSGNDTITGNGVANELSGGAGNDTITGAGGVDRITGGAGNDQMDGGAGNDFFLFSTDFGADIIAGFDANPVGGQDLLDVTSLGITSANFIARVTVAAGPIAGSTLLTIIDGVGGSETIQLNGVAPGAIDSTDFILSP